MNGAKNKYKSYCEGNDNIPLFLSYNWYNSLFDGNEWDVVIVEKKGNVTGFMPYQVFKKKSFTFIRPSMLTPYQGVWLNYPEDQKYANRLSFEKEVITEMIDKLPSVDSFQQKFHPHFTNWLPFYWKGFTQTTRYTYVINDLTDLEQVFGEFRDNIRREIRKAEKKLVVESFDDIDSLFQLKEKVYQSNHENYPIPKSLLKKVYDYCKNNNCGELLIAKDTEENIHSILLYVWDNNAAYYLHGGTDVTYKTTGSMSLLLWEAIKRSAQKTKTFNFEGSMMESIERYFRAFGGKQIPYFDISKTNSKLLKLLKH